MALLVKNSPANSGDTRDAGLIPGLGRSPRERNGNPLQYSWLENPWTEEPGESRRWQRVEHDWAQRIGSHQRRCIDETLAYEKCSKLYVITEMQIKIIMKYHYISIRMIRIQNIASTKYWWSIYLWSNKNSLF